MPFTVTPGEFTLLLPVSPKPDPSLEIWGQRQVPESLSAKRGKAAHLKGPDTFSELIVSGPFMLRCPNFGGHL